MSSITIKYCLLPHASDLPPPAYATTGASGMDLCAAIPGEQNLAPGEITLISTGLSIAVPPGFEAQVRPRSGLALKYGLIVVNSPGTIDADYRGEIGIILGNLGKTPYIIHRGDRIAQLVIAPVVVASLEPFGGEKFNEFGIQEIMSSIASRFRGIHGFGSTGLE